MSKYPTPTIYPTAINDPMTSASTPQQGQISFTSPVEQFPHWAVDQAPGTQRYQPMVTPTDMRNRSLFGIPLTSALTNQSLSDDAIQAYIDQAISEVEHDLDLYITPVTFDEKQDYSRHHTFWSFGYLKMEHSNILSVQKYQLTFNNGSPPPAPPLVDIPLEFIHIQSLEGTIQLVPAMGMSISGLIVSIFTGMGYHAFNTQIISNWPGAVRVVYTCGFSPDHIPALLVGLIENIAAYKTLSAIGPLLFPYNSISIGIDGTSQSTGTLGPAFFRQRMDELEKIIEKQTSAARGYYQKKFIIDYL